MQYDVVIVGGGVTGTALLYTLRNYTNIENILLVEKYPTFSELNSNSQSNSQTLHFGDIESNYTLEKARETKHASEMLLAYLNELPEGENAALVKKCHKMLLGVGEEEVKFLKRRFSKEMRELFPELRYLSKDEITAIEPKITEDRDPTEEIGALYSEKGYMVDFGKLSTSFVEHSKSCKKTGLEILLGTEVTRVKRTSDGFLLSTNKATYTTRTVVFAAGTYSLYFAKMLGYGKNLSTLSVGGSFYYTPHVLNGKVYRVEKGSVPFAAVHGDPDLNFPERTRFGPTATVLPLLEKGNFKTFSAYIKTAGLNGEAMFSIKSVLSDPEIKRIMAKNIKYGVPVIGKYSFLRDEARKIVPSLKYSDLKFADNTGGIRPQVIDIKKRKILMGELKITGNNVIFNMTPSPGATACIQTAYEDVDEIVRFIGAKFNRELFKKQFNQVNSV